MVCVHTYSELDNVYLTFCSCQLR